MLLDNIPSTLLIKAISQCRTELGRRLPIHSIHKWWSRRFAAIYRLILGAHLTDNVYIVEEALRNPSVLRPLSQNKTFFEPFAGGGTGLVEAALAGYDVCGVEINPVAATVAKIALSILSELPYDAKHAIEILDRALLHTKDIWFFNSAQISYLLLTRRKIPTWVSTIKSLKYVVAICPHCKYMATYPKPSDKMVIKCKICGEEFTLSLKGTITPPPSLPKMNDQIVFAVRLGENRAWVSLIDNEELVSYLERRNELACEMASEISERMKEVDISGLREYNRLRRRGLASLDKLFTPSQLLSFHIFASLTSKDSFMMTAASDAAKTCSMLAIWYPPIGEPLPAGALRANWIPDLGVEVNPLAHKIGTLRTLARGTIASAIKAQLRASDYVASIGRIRVKGKVILGDASEVEFPPHIDLAVIDPPYFKRILTYTSLAITHYAVMRLFTTELEDICDIERKELTTSSTRYGYVLSEVFKKISRSTNQSSRVVLMYNSLNEEIWKLLFNASKEARLYPVAAYLVLGEPHGTLIRSKLRGMFLIVFSKVPKKDVVIKFTNPLNEMMKLVSICEEIEQRGLTCLMKAMRAVYPSITVSLQ